VIILKMLDDLADDRFPMRGGAIARSGFDIPQSAQPLEAGKFPSRPMHAKRLGSHR